MRLIVALMLGLVLSGISLTSFAQPTENCPDTAQSRLTVGNEGRVLPGSPNNVRDEPNRSATVLDQIPGEGIFTVLEGPVCAEGISWWRVDYEGLVGWTAEAVGFEYAVESLAPYTTEVAAGGVSFTLPSEIALGAYDMTLETDGDVPMPLPLRIEFNFAYAADVYGYANVQVMPVAEFNKLYPAMLDAVAEQLETRPEVPTIADSIPFHPGNRAFIVQPAYVEFEGGAGIRAVTAATFSVDPLDQLMNYNFIGLTDNGTHVVLISVPVLSEAASAVEFDAEHFETYIDDLTAVVDAIPADEFAPSLTLIDAMVSTLKIDPETLALEVEAANKPPVICKVTPIADTNVRTGPSIDASVSGYAKAGTEYMADLQAWQAGETFPWWHLVEEAEVLPLGEGLPANGRWLRADFVTEVGDCDNLPQY